MADISVIGIWNMALGFIGTRTVGAEDENTQEAIQCKLFWDNARRQVLRDYPWNFAQRRALLANIALPIEWEFEYNYAYSLPNDCLKASKVWDAGRSEMVFSIAHNTEFGITCLLTNANKALLAYTADVKNSQLFDDLFCYIMARKLAALICIPLLKNNSNKLNELEQLYKLALIDGFRANSSEGGEREKVDTWLLARR